MDNVKEYIEQFSRYICAVSSKREKEIFKEIENYFIQHPINNNGLCGRVWVLLGETKNSEYVSLMVAQSEDIQNEIVFDVRAMLNLEYSAQKIISKKWDWEKEERYNLDVIKGPMLAKSDFTGESYLYPKESPKVKRKYLYRKLMKEYKRLLIYELNIDEYLGIKAINSIDENIKNIYLFGKDYYAESKLAIETGAKYWNFYKSGIGKRAYCYFKNKE